LEPTVFILVLIAATLHASWNALVKVGGDQLVMMVLLCLTAAALVLPLALWTGPPAPASWPYLALSVALHTVYFAMLVVIYRLGDLSHVYPLARGSAPLIVALLAALLGGEILGLWGVLGVVLISGGILILALGGRVLAGGGWRTVTAALLTGVTIAAYTVADGFGSRASGNVLGYIAWLFLLSGLPLLLYAVVVRGRALISGLRGSWRVGVLSGVFATSAYGLVIWAMARAPIPYVSALRETSVVIAALVGARLLREPFATRRISAAVIVVAGIALLQLGGMS
jgi:drug/metabolite transporter (DMT)-like permease